MTYKGPGISMPLPVRFLVLLCKFYSIKEFALSQPQLNLNWPDFNLALKVGF